MLAAVICGGLVQQDIKQQLMSTAISIPSMLSQQVNEYLTAVGKCWSGRGVAVECGAWLGSSTSYLGEGLLAAGYDRHLYVFDQFTANRQEVGKARKQGVTLTVGQNTQPVFESMIDGHTPEVVASRCRIEKAEWDGTPIEIWLLDAAKREGPFYHALRIFGPSWIPGVTVVGLLDFFYYRSFDLADPKRELYLEQEAFIERFCDRFTMVKDFDGQAPAFFRYEEPINWEREL